MTENNGGSAFPLYDNHGDGRQFLAECGMTLRDYFAAKAMQGICTQTQWENCKPDDIARWAYEQADAMLKARGA